MIFPSTGNGVVFLHDNKPPYIDAIFPATANGVVKIATIPSSIYISDLNPPDGAFNVPATSPISFIIRDAETVTPQEISISITVNSEAAINLGNYANGYSGAITYDSVLKAYSVTLYPRNEFADFVGYTITVENLEFDYTFKTKIVNKLLKTSNILNAMFSTRNYIFAATDSGLDVIDIVSQQNIAYAIKYEGFNSIWGKRLYITSDCVYMGTPNSGVYKLLLSDILRGGNVTQYLTQKFTTISTPSIASNTILSLHGNGNNLAILTPDNAYVINSETTKYSTTLSGTLTSGAIALSTTNDIHYTDSGVKIKYNISANWSSPDFTYNTGSTPSIGSTAIHGIFITTKSLFIATSNGLWVVSRENQGNEAAGSSKSFGYSGKTHNVLLSNNIKAVLGDTIDRINEGKIYCGDDLGNFYIISNKTNKLLYKYTTTTGNFGDFLNSSYIQSIVALY